MDPFIDFPPSIPAVFGAKGLTHGALPSRVSVPTTGASAGAVASAGPDPFFGQQIALPSGSAGTKIAIEGPLVSLASLNAVSIVASTNWGADSGLAFRIGLFGATSGACFEHIHSGADPVSFGSFLTGKSAGGVTRKACNFQNLNASAMTSTLQFAMWRDPKSADWLVAIGDDDGSGQRPPSRVRRFSAGNIDTESCVPRVEWERPNTAGPSITRRIGSFVTTFYRIGG